MIAVNPLGRPVIKGTDIKVSQVALEWTYLKMTESAIQEAHPHLTRSQVLEALNYFFSHREEIEAEWREADEASTAIQAKHPARS